ncbi:MAG TPA: MBL fold metallo-hydrolase [Candidatus Methylomirabilis sp.]|nr:MBL fold metallo-hydrolase [Candidatus Methylomirabilis sp.]
MLPELARPSRPATRREILKAGGALAGAGLISTFFPRNLFATQPSPYAFQQAGVASQDPLAQFRAQMAAIPLQTLKLCDNLTMLYGPGGNMVALDGPDGKILVDSSFVPVVPKIKEALTGISSSPLRVLINTHWHFDHTDGNALLHESGATILAHENTRRRLSTPQDIAAFGMHFPASPEAAWPQRTFSDTFQFYLSNENIFAGYVKPAHTDTDIFIRYEKGNVLHMGDIFFNGMYPFIDSSSGGSINGMIAGAESAFKLLDAETKIVPGHGPVGDKAALAKYRDMLVTVRDRVLAQKKAGRKVEEVVAAKPTADLDVAWGNGFLKPEQFVGIVYSTL